ncbi:sialidase family protein [Horticoccus sp. 23ND18S-11]|uniref:sialidase family protein n=1 Tax=Horticoccus sp. 23ND18S-11 TaxID=3391832 RepID=UPI0039C9D08A
MLSTPPRFLAPLVAAIALSAGLPPAAGAPAAKSSMVAASNVALPPSITRVIAIDNVCAWPMLVTLPDGTFVAVIHNRPSHGQMEGDVEVWASQDGAFWEKRGHPAPNDPRTVRMNVAAGLARNGDLLVLCSGWTDVKQPDRPKQGVFRDAVLPIWVCRSADGGRTWTQHKQFPDGERGWMPFIPFGPILVGEGGALHVSCYAGEFVDPAASTRTKSWRAWHFRSDDDGRTWRQTSVIGAKHNETAIFHLGGRNWLAAARIDAMEIFRSTDDGATWGDMRRVTDKNEINGHLARLKDGRILLSYGSRIAGQFGVLGKFSSDEGLTWSAPVRLVHSLEQDCGYPSSVQRPDGKIVTVYYAKRVENHERYHMGAAIWEAPAR